MVRYKVAEAKTGNFSTRSVRLPSLNVEALIKTTVGATPTVTANLQGSADETNWFNVATATIITATLTKLVKPAGEVYEFYRLDFSANTNVTIDLAYILGTEG